MDPRPNWIAASIFFLTGCILQAVPALVRAQLYAARMAGGSWTYPDSLVEEIVPYGLRGLSIGAFVLSAVMLLWPFLAKPVGSVIKAVVREEK